MVGNCAQFENLSWDLYDCQPKVSKLIFFLNWPSINQLKRQTATLENEQDFHF